MSLLHINWEPTDRQLRQFGLIGLIALPAIGWFWTREWGTAVQVLATCGLLLGLLGWLLPRALKPLFLGLTLITMPIGLVVGELTLLLIYFVVFLPIALLFKLTRSDALQRQLDKSAQTYWQRKQQPSHVAQYYRQF